VRAVFVRLPLIPHRNSDLLTETLFYRIITTLFEATYTITIPYLLTSMVLLREIISGGTLMKLIPLHDWAVIKPSAAEDVSAGGLYLPDTAKEKPAQGVVEAIGPGALEEEPYDKKKKKDPKERKFIKTTIKPGDYVLYEQYAGQTYKVGDEDRVLVRERNILGMLPGGAPKANPAPKPLQLPATTSASRSTSIVPAGGTRAITASGKKALATLSSVTPKKPAQPKKKAAKKAVKKAAKKKAVAPAKKAAKKAVPAKKKAAKKTGKKGIKKTAKKAKPAATKRKAAKPAKKKR
jgi:chaperonin GroES